MSSSAPQILRDIAERVEAFLAREMAVESARWVSIDPDLEAPFAEISRLVLAGGKRLRPALSHLAYMGMGGDPDSSRSIEVGAAIEMLHACALFHDDIMDGAATRRGDTTTHVRFQSQHEVNKWAGEPRRFGEGAALLIGDLAYALSDRMMGEVAPEVRNVWHELRIEVNIGQYLDVLGSAQRERRRDKTDRVCRYKSGKYTIERPLHLGALLAAPHRSSDVLAMFSAYGLPLGDAFQMRDDVLGAFGDTAVTGKPVGDDLREGKPTPLIARAYERADVVQTKVLDTVGTPGMTDADVARVQQVIIDTGALAELENLITTLRDEAVAAARSMKLEHGVSGQLVDLAHYISDRQV